MASPTFSPTPDCPLTFGPAVRLQDDAGVWKWEHPPAKPCRGSNCAWWDPSTTPNLGACVKSASDIPKWWATP
jgi:hypothetical protein